MADAIEQPSPFYHFMYPGWRRAEILEGGTDVYRAAALGQDSGSVLTDDGSIVGDYGPEIFLPRYPNEENEDYEWRVRQIFVNPIFSEMSQAMTSRIFREEPSYTGSLAKYIDDLDLRGSTMKTVMRRFVSSLLSRGKCHALVEHPQNPAATEGRKPTYLDEIAYNLRPFVEIIHPKSVIGATAERWGGVEIYSSLRILDMMHSEDPQTFEQKQERRLRIYRRTDAGVTLDILTKEVGGGEGNAQWKSKFGEPRLLKARNGDSMKIIPFVTGLADEKGFEYSDQPLAAVAWKNIEYQHASANLRHLLSIVAHPQLTITGLDKVMTAEELKPIRSPRAILQGTASKNEGVDGVKFAWIGAEMDGIEQLVSDLSRVFDEAEAAGIRLLIKRAVQQTATAETLDDLTESSPLEVIAASADQAATKMMAMFQQWETGKYDPKSGGEVQLSKEFTILGDDDDAMKFAMELRKNGDLDRRTVLEQAIKRRRLRSDVDLDEVERRLGEEEAAAAAQFREMQDDQNDPANDTIEGNA